MGSVGVSLKSRKRPIETTHEDECGEEFDVLSEHDSMRVPKAIRKRGKRLSCTFREVLTLAKMEHDPNALECVLSRLPEDILKKVACMSTLWCTVVYRVLRRNLGGSSPFVRVWMAQSYETESYMNFSGELHYHPELLTDTVGDNQRPSIPKIDTVITLGTRVMEDIFYDEELKFPSETVIYGLTDRVLANTSNYWNPFQKYDDGWQIQETRSMVTSLFIPKSDYFDIVPFSTPLNSHELGLCDKKLFDDIVRKNYQLEASDEMPMEGSMKAVLMFQFHKDSFLQSFVDCANEQKINALGGIFTVIGFNSNDEHHTAGVGLSFWAKTDDSSCLNISSYGVCMTNPGAEQIIVQMKEQCSNYQHAFVIMFSCPNYEEPGQNKEMKAVSEEEYLEDDQYWSAQPDQSRSTNVKDGIKLFRHYLPNVPMVGAVLHCPLVLGTAALGDKGADGPIDLAFLVVTYN